MFNYTFTQSRKVCNGVRDISYGNTKLKLLCAVGISDRRILLLSFYKLSYNITITRFQLLSF